jgi:transposase
LAAVLRETLTAHRKVPITVGSLSLGSRSVRCALGRQQERHRLSRAGDRHANAALSRIVMTRIDYDPRTKLYIDRRMKEGLSTREAMRCLRRYVAREVFELLPRPRAA